MPKRVHRSAKTFIYVLLADRGNPVDQQSRFHFRPLTQGEHLAVLDGMNWVSVKSDGSRELLPRSFQQARTLVIEHLLSAENFPLDGAMPWPVDGSREEKEAYLAMLDAMDLLELGNELRYHAEPIRSVATPNGDVSLGN